MKNTLSIYWWAVKNTYEELFTIAGINLTWLVIGFGLPTAVSYLELPWLSIVLLLFLLPPPTAGVYCYARELSRDGSASFSVFWEGTKKYVVKSWLVAWLGVLVSGMLAANIWFYGLQYEGGWVIWVQAFFLSLLVYWLATQIYLFPMLLSLKEEKLLLAIRNAALLVVTNPLFTLVLALLLVATIVLSVVVVLPAVFLTTALVALVANRAVVHLLTKFLERTEDGSPD